MTLQEANLEEVLLHLRHSLAAMRRLMAVSEDWTGKGLVEMGFWGLQERIREFAECEFGLIPQQVTQQR